MKKTQGLQIGNYLYFKNTHDLAIVHLINGEKHFDCRDEYGSFIPNGNYEPITLNDEWLLNLGFEKIPNKMYINGFKYFLHTEGLNYENYHKDGTYFDGIGTIQNNGNLVVNTLCRGNYVCNSVQYVHELQNLYYSLTEKELVYKKL